jgi:septal ring factor EnvC (AmiA/AmiB activator)
MEFNRVLGICGNLISDPLCEKLTDIEPDRMVPSLAMQETYLKIISPNLARANAFIKKEDQYRFELQIPTEETDSYLFKQEQIRVIAENIGGEILRLRTAQAGKDQEAHEMHRQLAHLTSENQRIAEDLKRLNEEVRAKSMEIHTLKMAMEKSAADNENSGIIHEVRHLAYRVKKHIRRTFHVIRKN